MDFEFVRHEPLYDRILLVLTLDRQKMKERILIGEELQIRFRLQGYDDKEVNSCGSLQLIPRRVPPPERPSALHWFGSMRRAAIPPFRTVGVPSSFPARRASAARRQVPKSRFL